MSETQRCLKAGREYDNTCLQDQPGTLWVRKAGPPPSSHQDTQESLPPPAPEPLTLQSHFLKTPWRQRQVDPGLAGAQTCHPCTSIWRLRRRLIRKGLNPLLVSLDQGEGHMSDIVIWSPKAHSVLGWHPCLVSPMAGSHVLSLSPLGKSSASRFILISALPTTFVKFPFDQGLIYF